MKKKITVISVIMYAIALLFFVGMYAKGEKSIEFYNSVLSSYSQPLQASSYATEDTEAKSHLITGQIKEMDAVLTQKPSNLDIGYELLELAKKNNLVIVSLSSKGANRQTIIKSPYQVQSFNIAVVGSSQDIINMMGDLQSFRLGSLLIDSVNFSPKKEASRADIYLSLHSKEVKDSASNTEPTKDKVSATGNLDARKTAER